MIVLITLTTAGLDAGPFDLFSNVNGYSIAFATNVTKSVLLAGYTSSAVPNSTTTVRVKSKGVCTNYVDISVVVPTTTSTTSTTTTVAPSISFQGSRSCSFTTSGGTGSSCGNSGTFNIIGGVYNIKGYVSIDTGPTPLTNCELTLIIDGIEYRVSTSSPYAAGYTNNIPCGPGQHTFSYLVTGSGGTNTGGGGGLLDSLVN